MNQKKPDPLQFHADEIQADVSYEGDAAKITPMGLVMKRFLRNKLAIAGLVILGAMILFSIFGPMFSPYGEYQMFFSQNGQEILDAKADTSKMEGVSIFNKQPPSARHLLGTDKDGMDIMTRLMHGGRISLLIGFVVMAIELIIGVILGGLAGFFGKWVDMAIMRVVEVFFCIPTIPVLLIIGSILATLKVPQQSKIFYLMLAFGFLGWAGVARMVRGQILSLREQEYMVATEAVGLTTRQKIFRHLIPNVMPQLIVITTLGIGDAILMESALSFLGMGVPHPYASWGKIVQMVNDPVVMTNYPFMWVPAGVLICLTVLAFNFVGDGLRDAFDPKMKR
ncbi:MAG: ABC transporter permease [Angelakisella sp.]